MSPTDLTIKVLTEIRQEIRGTNARVDGLVAEIRGSNARVDGLASELHGMREELSRRIVESEVQTSTAIADLAGTVREMTSVLRTANDLRPRVEQCEREIAAIKLRAG